MRPKNLKTKIFLDSFSPKDTQEVLSVLGFLDGQTTNPNQVSKDPYAEEYIKKGNKFDKEEIWNFYKKNIIEISKLIPQGSVSIEVYIDENTTSDEIFTQAKEMYHWIPNAHIKYPITKSGLEVVKNGVKEKMRANLTLCFSQEQAAAVYSATLGAPKGNIFISPFVGRLDDIGENGISLIKNILEMYKNGDGHVEVLAASIRTLDQFLACLALEVNIITAMPSVLIEWGKAGMSIPNQDFAYNATQLKNIPYQKINLNKNWANYNIKNELTDKGLAQFVSNWNALIK